MIQNKTARRLMYEWHGGQSSALYAAASSGLVESFVLLADEIMAINSDDRGRLLSWVQNKQITAPRVYIIDRNYAALPWVGRA